jgi:phospholipid/cholesterol/gamma-HCH transport system ATP-binding protein
MVMTKNIDKMIKETKEKRGTTSIVITHDINSAFRIADRIAIHSGGKILEIGTPEEIKNSKLKDTRLLLGEEDE